MSEFLQRLSGGDLIILTLWLVIGVVWLTWIVAQQWRRARETELEIMLKQQMLERGMSADEIVKVLKAPTRNSPPCDSNQS